MAVPLLARPGWGRGDVGAKQTHRTGGRQARRHGASIFPGAALAVRLLLHRMVPLHDWAGAVRAVKARGGLPVWQCEPQVPKPPAPQKKMTA